MSSHRNPFYWSLPAGTWYYTQVRISVFFPLLVFVVCYRLEDVRLGLAFSGALFLSVVLHEFGHVVAARLTGGAGDEIFIWPLGGLAFVRPAATFSSQILTSSAGLIVNAILCLLTLPALLFDSPYVREALHPFQLPAVALSGHVVSDLFVLLFCANWVLLLMNLIPVYPLDGGQILQACLSVRLSRDVGRAIYLRVGCVFAFVMLFGGVMFDNTWVLLIGTVVLVLNLQEAYQLHTGETYDESFMGYDFSQGYTSLERIESPQRSARPGFFQCWRKKRQAERERRLQEKEEQLEHTLDSLLEKVHTFGFDSLTENEKRQLNRASAMYRKKEDE